MLKNSFRAIVKTIALPATLFAGFILLLTNGVMFFSYWWNDKTEDPWMKKHRKEEFATWRWWLKFWDGRLKK